ncbi:hypothetical protein HPSNT_03690 [Helicobacter pylori SNT49]|uniref:Uncharacterized protein n=1 Tax=Helicobacter pylori SNT49 TaxID=1055530 RepID=G2MEC6_HELPX|nr:hypothetical protein HPSNT_03690 [Helicobacter pylori SNT49]
MKRTNQTILLSLSVNDKMKILLSIFRFYNQYAIK